MAEKRGQGSRCRLRGRAHRLTVALVGGRPVLDAGELGNEGFHSALRLGGDTVSELKRLVFRPEPRDE